jgi:stress-induced morphogen
MISRDIIARYIRQLMPDAEVTLVDRTGTMDHYQVQIVSELFQGKSRLDRQRLVYQALDEPMKDGRIHALEIKAQTPEEVTAS